jgi:hypothetical protein
LVAAFFISTCILSSNTDPVKDKFFKQNTPILKYSILFIRFTPIKLQSHAHAPPNHKNTERQHPTSPQKLDDPNEVGRC